MKWKVDEGECAKDVLERKKKFIEMNKPKGSPSKCSPKLTKQRLRKLSA